MFPTMLVRTVTFNAQNSIKITCRNQSKLRAKIALVRDEIADNNAIRIYSRASMSVGWHSKKIVPDVIDDTPTRKLTVEFPTVSINEGTIVKPSQALQTPQVKWKVKDTHYALVFTNPDVPHRGQQKKGEWIQWLVVNIPQDHIEKGETLVEYVPPCPPKGVVHRYVFLLYKQPSHIKFSEPKIDRCSGKERYGFLTREFVKRYKLGIPYAGNFFESEYDENVPNLWKQLKLSE